MLDDSLARYIYLVASSAFLLPWALIFWRRADLRREMLWISALSVSSALPFEYFFWTRDWWHPLTLTGTPIGIEDVVYAVGQGGLFATLFCVLFRQRSVPAPAGTASAIRALGRSLPLGDASPPLWARDQR